MKPETKPSRPKIHPTTFALFAFAAGVFVGRTSPDIAPALAGLFCAAVALVWIWLWCDARCLAVAFAAGAFCTVIMFALAWIWRVPRALVVALCLAFAVGNARADEPGPIEPAAPIITGAVRVVTVFVVSTGINYVILRVCLWLFPPPPSSPVPNGGPTNTPPVFVASYMPEHDYCVEAASHAPARLVKITVDCAAPRISEIHILPPGQTLTRAQYADALSAIGNAPGPLPTYSSNGVQVASIPITIGPDLSWEIAGDDPVTITLESSDDLLTWEQIARATQPAGARAVFWDASVSASRFYRVVK